jgi:hypothetical protein
MSGGTGEGTADVLRSLVKQIELVHAQDQETPKWQP